MFASKTKKKSLLFFFLPEKKTLLFSAHDQENLNDLVQSWIKLKVDQPTFKLNFLVLKLNPIKIKFWETVQPTFKLHFLVLKLNPIKIKFWETVQPTFKLHFLVLKLNQIKIKFWQVVQPTFKLHFFVLKLNQIKISIPLFFLLFCYEKKKAFFFLVLNTVQVKKLVILSSQVKLSWVFLSILCHRKKS